MKSTDAFKETIQKFLENKANTDELFLPVYEKENKNIDDCITYILNQVQKSGCNGFTDDEIFGMAVHYFDEDNIEVGKPMTNAHIVVNHTVELTEEEKAEAKQKAIDQAISEAKAKLVKKHTPTPVKSEEKKPEVAQQSLF